MHRLAKLGFSQSYTYFTWRNTKHELTEYFTELCHGPGRDYFRPNVWPNTPDILPVSLQYGGRAGVHGARRAGRHAGRELRHLRAGVRAAGERADPARRRGVPATPRSTSAASGTWTRADSLADFIAALNRARHDNPALQSDEGLQLRASGQRPADRLRQGHRRSRQRHRVRGQPRPASPAERLGRTRPAGVGPASRSRPTRCTT